MCIIQELKILQGQDTRVLITTCWSLVAERTLVICLAFVCLRPSRTHEFSPMINSAKWLLYLDWQRSYHVHIDEHNRVSGCFSVISWNKEHHGDVRNFSWNHWRVLVKGVVHDSVTACHWQELSWVSNQPTRWNKGRPNRFDRYLFATISNISPTYAQKGFE